MKKTAKPAAPKIEGLNSALEWIGELGRTPTMDELIETIDSDIRGILMDGDASGLETHMLRDVRNLCMIRELLITRDAKCHEQLMKSLGKVRTVTVKLPTDLLATIEKQARAKGYTTQELGIRILHREAKRQLAAKAPRQRATKPASASANGERRH